MLLFVMEIYNNNVCEVIEDNIVTMDINLVSTNSWYQEITVDKIPLVT